MTVKLSPHKVAKIVRLYFSGLAQIKIAKKAGVDQSCVSIYATRFKERAGEIGLLAAGKEFEVFDEVSALRSLSIELSKAKLTVDEAKEGTKVVKAFTELGVAPKKYIELAKVSKQIEDPGFIHAAVKLAKIETESGMSYEDVLSRFEKIVSELPSTKKQLQEAESKLQAVEESVGQRKQELVSLEEQLKQLQKKVKVKVAQLNEELASKMEQSSVKDSEIKEVAQLKAYLGKSGLDIPTLVKLAEEFNYGESKS